MGDVVVAGRCLDLRSGRDRYRVSGRSISHGHRDNHEVGILERLGDVDQPGAKHSDGDLVTDDGRDGAGFTTHAVFPSDGAGERGHLLRGDIGGQHRLLGGRNNRCAHIFIDRLMHGPGECSGDHCICRRLL